MNQDFSIAELNRNDRMFEYSIEKKRDKLDLTGKSSLRVRSKATHREEKEHRVLDSHWSLELTKRRVLDSFQSLELTRTSL
ncbi:MAG: hypothetical protein CMF23_08230 [Ignavibacteriae bacterium]|nr:hypothetical protein [Ignavibacteriota bacterium]